MRRVFPVALLGALLAVAPAVRAQRGGTGQVGGFGGHVAGPSGHSFGGGVGSAGRIGGFTPHAFGTPGRAFAAPGRIIGPAPRIGSTMPGRAFVPRYQHTPSWGFADRSRPTYGSGYGSGHQGWGDHRRDRNHHREPYPGYGYGYGFGGYPYGAYANSWELLPGDLGSQDFAGDNSGYDSGYDNGQDANAAPAQPPPDQEQYSEPEPPPDSGGYGSGYPAFAYPAYPYTAMPGSSWMVPNQPSSDPVAPEPELRLLFKDGHQQTIRNYVLTPSSVIVMDQASSGRQQRIPLADLDLPATEQAAQQAGLEFRPPSKNHPN